MSQRQTAVLALKSVAAQAAKLADDLENNRLWDREFDVALGEIQRALQSVPAGVR